MKLLKWFMSCERTMSETLLSCQCNTSWFIWYHQLWFLNFTLRSTSVAPVPFPDVYNEPKPEGTALQKKETFPDTFPCYSDAMDSTKGPPALQDLLRCFSLHSVLKLWRWESHCPLKTQGTSPSQRRAQEDRTGGSAEFHFRQKRTISLLCRLFWLLSNSKAWSASMHLAFVYRLPQPAIPTLPHTDMLVEDYKWIHSFLLGYLAPTCCLTI